MALSQSGQLLLKRRCEVRALFQDGLEEIDQTPRALNKAKTEGERSDLRCDQLVQRQLKRGNLPDRSDQPRPLAK